jgi:hypothetical protein
MCVIVGMDDEQCSVLREAGYDPNDPEVAWAITRVRSELSSLRGIVTQQGG